MASQSTVLDMSLFFGNEEQKDRFCHELLDTLKRRGCVKITNHSIPAEDVYKLFDMVRYASDMVVYHIEVITDSAVDQEVLRASSRR